MSYSVPAPFAHVQTFSHKQQWQQQQQPAVMLNVPLERTSEPVWPEDENTEIAQHDGTTIPFLADKEADAALDNITVELPDRLIPTVAQDSGSAGIPPGLQLGLTGGDYNYVAFHIPPSFSAPESLILRRLQLKVILSSQNGMAPIAIFITPGTDVDVIVKKVGEIGVDIGKILSALLPQLPPVFTASVGTKLDVTSVHPKIQTAGLLKHNCSWRVADSRIAYDFNPALVAQFSQSLMVSVSLHVEVRKQVLGVFHKTYGKSATPMSYVYRPGQPLMTAFDYLEQFKNLGLDTEPYENEISGSQAFYRLGKQLEEQDEVKAKIWYRRAADAGNVAAMIRLAQQAEQRDQAEAEKWYRKAADGGHTDAMIRLGDLTQGRDPALANSWYQRAADAGGSQVMARLGRLFEKRDQAKAESWYAQAAEAGDSAAMVRLGRLTDARDPSQAKAWYRRAADANNLTAMLRLGKLAEEAGDRATASSWYQKAANAGSYEARNALKRLHPWKHFFIRSRR